MMYQFLARPDNAYKQSYRSVISAKSASEAIEKGTAEFLAFFPDENITAYTCSASPHG